MPHANANANATANRGFVMLVLTALTALGMSCAPRSAEHPSTMAGPPAPPIARTLLEHHDLEESPGWEMRLYLIHYEPGVAAPAHHHPVEGLGYVVRGSFESAFQGEAPVVIHEGQSFRDRCAGSTHALSKRRPFEASGLRDRIHRSQGLAGRGDTVISRGATRGVSATAQKGEGERGRDSERTLRHARREHEAGQFGDSTVAPASPSAPVAPVGPAAPVVVATATVAGAGTTTSRKRARGPRLGCGGIRRGRAECHPFG